MTAVAWLSSNSLDDALKLHGCLGFLRRKSPLHYFFVSVQPSVQGLLWACLAGKGLDLGFLWVLESGGRRFGNWLFWG